MVKRLVLRAAKMLGLFAVSRRLTRRGLRILCYHGIWLGDGHFGDYLFMRPETFRARVRRIRELGYPVLALDDAIARLEAGTLPPCATVITIDDGWYGSYRHMVDALAAERLPATLYACTYYIQNQRPVFTVAVNYVVATARVRALDLDALIPGDAGGTANLDDPRAADRAVDRVIAYGEGLAADADRQELLRRLGASLGADVGALADSRIVGLMSEDELRDAAAKGLDVQLHTHRHRFPREAAALEREIVDNRAALEPLVGRPMNHLCYPSGDYDRTAWPLLSRLGIRSATTTERGFNHAGTPPLALKRLIDGEVVEPIEFEAELSGFTELIRRLRHRRGPVVSAG
ncbi:MAG: polysaccharide deacetylase family protein [Alphaproteobacteria bacterium]